MGKYFNNKYQKVNMNLVKRRNVHLLMDATRQAIMLCAITTLMDKYDFREKRVNRFIIRTYELFNKVKPNVARVTSRKDSDRLILRTKAAYIESILGALHELYGYGPKRQKEFEEWMNYYYDSFERGYVTSDDLKITIKEELGIEV